MEMIEIKERMCKNAVFIDLGSVTMATSEEFE